MVLALCSSVHVNQPGELKCRFVLFSLSRPSSPSRSSFSPSPSFSDSERHIMRNVNVNVARLAKVNDSVGCDIVPCFAQLLDVEHQIDVDAIGCALAANVQEKDVREFRAAVCVVDHNGEQTVDVAFSAPVNASAETLCREGFRHFLRAHGARLFSDDKAFVENVVRE